MTISFEEKKESTRHRKWHTVKFYSRLGVNRSQRSKLIEIEQVPLTEAVKAKALKVFTENIQVNNWENR